MPNIRKDVRPHQPAPPPPLDELLLPHERALTEKPRPFPSPLPLPQHPGLRRDQYREKLFQAFKKHKDNPYNAVSAWPTLVDQNLTADASFGL